jgi:hypothetical protein
VWCGGKNNGGGEGIGFAEAFALYRSWFRTSFPNPYKHYSFEPVPPATMRFMRLISKIDVKHYDQVYIALKAIAKLSGSAEAK